MFNKLSDRLIGPIAISFIALANPCAAQDSKSAFTLPIGIAPKTYDLYVAPDLQKRSFAGKETVTIVVDLPVTEVVLNGAELKINDASLLDSADKLLGRLEVRPEPKFERIHFISKKTVAPGTYKVAIDFTGILNDKLRGFYRSEFKDGDGKIHLIATTQMEPTDARRMFPCFDEPRYKATYKVTAAIDPALTAISNSPIADDKVDKATNRRVIRFAETPKMSSYLLALVVGPFKSTASITSDGVPIKVWCVGDRIALGTYAQQVAVKLLHYYNSYFGVPYPAKKLDLIAIPDFEAGAMENLGAITFRESRFLIDAKSASTASKMEVTSIVAHEMAHMWFGDLVTMKWWDDLWLNEAFATWMATKASDLLRPEWHRWNEFAVARSHAMGSDSLVSTRSIHFTVDDPLQANEMFDEITYTKGASILRMLERFVGEDVFQKGIQSYISAHQFSNATTNDLWAAIGQAANLDVAALMKNWVLEKGYPLISITQADGVLNLSQLRFFLIAPSAAPKVVWRVPLGLREAQSNEAQKFLLEEQDKKLEKLLTPPFTANAYGNGYYRVKYTADQLKALSDSIGKFDVQERLMLISDQWALCYAGQIPVGAFLDLTENYANELDPSVMTVLIEKFEELYKFVEPAQRPAFANLIRHTLQNQIKTLGWKPQLDETDLQAVLRVNVLKTLGTIGQDQSVIAEARKLFDTYLKNSKPFDANLADAITEIVAYNGGPAEYGQITKLWRTARVPEVEIRNEMALGCFRQPALIDQTLALCLTDTVRTQDMPHLVGNIVGNCETSSQAWAFLKTHWKPLSGRLSETGAPKLVSPAASSFSTPQEEKDVRNFMAAHPLPAGKRTVAKMLEWVHGNVLFREKGGKQLNELLAKR